MSGTDRRYLFDTNAVVALFRGNVFLQNLAHETEWMGVSIITQLEFLSFPGLTESDELLFMRFAERVDIVNLDGQRLAFSCADLSNHASTQFSGR